MSSERSYAPALPRFSVGTTMGEILLNLGEIRAFITVARTGSVQGAAEKLNLTQSAVSRLVQRLETDLGAVLFDRNAKPLALTSDGRLALEHGLRVLGSAEAFARALKPEAVPCGVLRIGTAHALAEVIAERPLDLLRTLFPNVTLNISVDWAKPLMAKVERGDLDAVLLSMLAEGAPTTDLPARLVQREEVRIIGAESLAAKSWPSLEAMNEIGWVIQPEGCGYRSALAKALNGAGGPKIIVESFDKDLHLSVVARCGAFGLMPASRAETIPPERGITTFAIPDFHCVVSTWFVRGQPGSRMARALDELEDTILETLARAGTPTKQNQE